jgi:DNA-binding CsgD family transcriptional regulator
MTPTQRRTLIIQLAEQVCTPKELDALARALAGASHQTISVALNISTRTVRDRLDNATRKITNHPDYPKEPT